MNTITSPLTAQANAPVLRASRQPHCVLCGSAGRILHPDVPDYYFGVPGSWSLRRCDSAACGLIWQDPMVIDADLIHAYTNYYTRAGAESEVQGKNTDDFGAVFFWLERQTTRVLRLASERQRFHSAYLDRLVPGSLLDVGCGDGDFAAIMQRRGWTVRGSDFDAHAAATAQEMHGIAVDVGDLRDIHHDDASFDAVTARHVIEHVREPVEFVAECWRILKPGGRLVFITPNAGSLGHRHFGDRWRGLEQPRHLFLFNAPAMRALFHRAGIETVEVFSSAQGGMYVTRRSADTSRGILRRCIDHAAIWWLQFRETFLIRRGRHVGEELVAVASKPLA